MSPWWLVVTYLLHTWGELSLSPVGLSATTKLAPTRVVSLMMGVFYLAISVRNLHRRPPVVAVWLDAAAQPVRRDCRGRRRGRSCLFALTPPIKRLMGV